MAKPNQTDGAYLMKLVLYLMLGSVWLKINRGQNLQIPVPIGLITGLIFASHEHFQIDRKIEYAVLLIAALIGFWLSFGLYLNI